MIGTAATKANSAIKAIRIKERIMVFGRLLLAGIAKQVFDVDVIADERQT